MDRKKELKEQYKRMKPEMGVFVISSNFSDKCYIEATQDLKGRINGTLFKLNAGAHPNRELQKDWNEHGEAAFTVNILEKLEYDKDESKTDYSEELALLKAMWEDILAKDNKKFY